MTRQPVPGEQGSYAQIARDAGLAAVLLNACECTDWFDGTHPQHTAHHIADRSRASSQVGFDIRHNRALALNSDQDHA